MGDMMSDIVSGNAQAVAYAIAHPEEPMSAKTLIANQAQQGALLASGYPPAAPLPTSTPAGWNPTVWAGVLQGRLVSPDGVQASIASVNPALAAQIAQTAQISQQTPIAPAPILPGRTVKPPLGYLLPAGTGSSASDMLSAPVFGIPTWMLLAGGVGALILFGGKH